MWIFHCLLLSAAQAAITEHAIRFRCLLQISLGIPLVKCMARKACSTPITPHILPSNENALAAKISSNCCQYNRWNRCWCLFVPQHLCIIFILFHLRAHCAPGAGCEVSQKVYWCNKLLFAQSCVLCFSTWLAGRHANGAGAAATAHLSHMCCVSRLHMTLCTFNRSNKTPAKGICSVPSPAPSLPAIYSRAANGNGKWKMSFCYRRRGLLGICLLPC